MKSKHGDLGLARPRHHHRAGFHLADAHVAGQIDVDAGDLRLGMQERALHFLRRGEETLAGAGQPRAGG